MQVGFVRLFGRIKEPKTHLLTSDLYLSSKPFSELANAK